MPAFIFAGAINVSTPQQNAAGVLIGQNAAGGWDANMKFNTSQGGNFGVFSVQITGMNITFDNLELIDGVINDQDIKISPSVEF